MSIVVSKAATGSLPVGTGQVQIMSGQSTGRFDPDDYILNANIPPAIPLKHLKLNVALTQVVVMTPAERDSVDAFQAEAQKQAMVIAPRLQQFFDNQAALPAPGPDNNGKMVGVTDAGAGSPGIAVSFDGVWRMLALS